MRRSLAAVALLAGCSANLVVARPDVRVTARAPDGSGQRVTLYGHTGYTRELSETVEIEGPGGVHATARLRDLLSGCPALQAGSAGDCTLRGTERVIIDRDHPPGHRGQAIVDGIFGAVLLGGMIYCAAECGSPGNYIAGGGLGLLGLALVGGAAAIAIGASSAGKD